MANRKTCEHGLDICKTIPYFPPSFFKSHPVLLKFKKKKSFYTFIWNSCYNQRVHMLIALRQLTVCLHDLSQAEENYDWQNWANSKKWDKYFCYSKAKTVWQHQHLSMKGLYWNIKTLASRIPNGFDLYLNWLWWNQLDPCVAETLHPGQATKGGALYLVFLA